MKCRYLADIQSGKKRPTTSRPESSEQIRAKIAEQKARETAQLAMLQKLVAQQHENEGQRLKEATILLQRAVLNKGPLQLHLVAWRIDTEGLSPHQKLALAGGWSDDYAAMRAREEALSSLLFNM
jgi:hypothetical protein